MSTHALLQILFIIAWAVLAFEVIRVLARLSGLDRRLAGYTAIAVALAFFLGATGPLAWTFGDREKPTQTAAPGTTTSVARVVSCPRDAVLSPRHAVGYIDSVGVAGGAPGPNSGTVSLSAGRELQLNGWAALSSGPGVAICGIEDGLPVPGIAAYGGDRPDVAAATNNPANRQSGFSVSLKAARGAHIVTVGVVESDGRSVDRLPGQLVVNSR